MNNKIFILLFSIVILFSGILAHSQMADDPNTTNTLTLDDAITIAVNSNTLITQAIELKKAAIEGMKAAKADFLPKASYSYNHTTLKDQQVTTLGGVSFPVGSTHNTDMNFTLTQPLFTGFAIITAYRISQLGVDISDVAREQAILDVVKQVKIAYYNILLAKVEIAVAVEAVQQLQSHERDAQAFFDQGTIPYNDLLKSKVALANAVQANVQAESNLETAISSFNTLLRFDVNQKIEIKELPQITTSTLELNTLISEAEQNRPELKSLDLQIKKAEQEVTLTKSTYYPTIALVANHERTGQDWAAQDNEFGLEHNSSISLTLNWVFFEWGKKSAEVRGARYQKNALVEQTKGVEDSIKLEVKSNYLNFNVSVKNIETARGALAQAEENFRITNLQYQQQVATSTDVLDARTFLTQAQRNFYGSLFGNLTAMAELERSVGGKSPEITAVIDEGFGRDKK